MWPATCSAPWPLHPKTWAAEANKRWFHLPLLQPQQWAREDQGANRARTRAWAPHLDPRRSRVRSVPRQEAREPTYSAGGLVFLLTVDALLVFGSARATD